MSAWYIFSTLGFYPVNAADGTFVFGSPQVKKATIKVSNEQQLTIKAKHFSNENIFQESPSLNKEKLKRNFIRYPELMQGGNLRFYMTCH
jgi:putative alpha-1,2-mannosidase